MDKSFPHRLLCLAEALQTDHKNVVRYLQKYFKSGVDYIIVTRGSGPDGRKQTFWLSESCCRHMVFLGEGVLGKSEPTAAWQLAPLVTHRPVVEN